MQKAAAGKYDGTESRSLWRSHNAYDRRFVSTSLLGGFWPDRPRFQLSFPLQLCVVQATCIAESSRAIGAASPFRRVLPIAAVASSRWRSSLCGKLVKSRPQDTGCRQTYSSSLFHFGDPSILRLQTFVHRNVLVLVGAFRLVLSLSLLKVGQHDIPQAFE